MWEWGGGGGVFLTKGGLHRDGGGLLRLVAQAKHVDRLNAENVGFPRDQTVDHKPEKTTDGAQAFILVNPSPLLAPTSHLLCLKGLWLHANQLLDPAARPSM